MGTMNISMWTLEHNQLLQKIRDTINTNDIPMQQWQVFCLVAAKPGVGSQELRQVLNMTGGSLSRHIKQLSTYYKKDKAGNDVQHGYNMIKPEVDPYERRNLIYYPTEKGKKIHQEIFNHWQKQMSQCLCESCDYKRETTV